MKLTETTRQIRLQQWYHLIQEQKSSGLTVEKWCESKQISPGSYYYHLKKVVKQLFWNCRQHLMQIRPFHLYTLNSAAERTIRSFTVGRKNFVLINTIKGAQASAVLYSIAETAKANTLRPYQYFEYLLEKTPEHMEDTSLDFLEELLPWSDQLPQSIRKTES